MGDVAATIRSKVQQEARHTRPLTEPPFPIPRPYIWMFLPASNLAEISQEADWQVAQAGIVQAAPG